MNLVPTCSQESMIISNTSMCCEHRCCWQVTQNFTDFPAASTFCSTQKLQDWYCNESRHENVGSFFIIFCNWMGKEAFNFSSASRHTDLIKSHLLSPCVFCYKTSFESNLKINELRNRQIKLSHVWSVLSHKPPYLEMLVLLHDHPGCPGLSAHCMELKLHFLD